MTCAHVERGSIVSESNNNKNNTNPTTSKNYQETTRRSSSSSSSPTKRRLSFGKIEVREYERIITDDDPCVSLGLALGWNYKDGISIPVKEMEEKRGAKEVDVRTFGTQPLRTSERLKILSNFGYSNREIIKAERNRVNSLEYVISCPCIPLMIFKSHVKNFYNNKRNSKKAPTASC